MDAEDDLYDEFGNYIGPDQEDEDLDGEGVDDEEFVRSLSETRRLTCRSIAVQQSPFIGMSANS